MVSLLGRDLFLHRSQRLQARSCAATALRSPTLVFPQLLAAAISRVFFHGNLVTMVLLTLPLSALLISAASAAKCWNVRTAGGF